MLITRQAVGREGPCGKSLYFLLNFSVNLKISKKKKIGLFIKKKKSVKKGSVLY